MALSKKEEARWIALNNILHVLEAVESGAHGTYWRFMSNKFMSEEKKKLAHEEVRNIMDQLQNRFIKLDTKIGV